LKANAYGHGALRLSLLYEKWGASALAFATAEEAWEARAAGVSLPLLILGHTDPALAPALASRGILPTVHSPACAQALSRAAARAGVFLPVSLKLDTGMGRIGFCVRAGREEDCARALLAAARLPNLRAVGLFTHFSSADESGVGVDYTKNQLHRFLVVRNILKRAGLALPAHAANSAAVLSYPAAHLDMIRPGLALYGIPPVRGGPPLIPALAVKATVAQVKWVGRGDAVGYGRAFIAPRAMRLATLTIGYADRLFRRAAETGGGVEAMPPKEGGASRKKPPVFLPFVGRISMDACTVDATAAPFLRMGDAVRVLGGGGCVSVSAAAAREGTIPYEILTRLSPRLSIFYLGDTRVL
jgi:alanine racemase